jgi:hypothetical protein
MIETNINYKGTTSFIIATNINGKATNSHWVEAHNMYKGTT